MMENKEDYKIYSTVEKQEVEWLWYPYIPYGKLTLLQGDPGDGKSTFMINIASALTRGGLLPDGKKLEQIGNVIYQGAEDNVGDTIKPRLEEAGADCDKVAFIDDADMGLTFIDDRLEKTIRSFQAKLLVLIHFRHSCLLMRICRMQAMSVSLCVNLGKLQKNINVRW